MKGITKKLIRDAIQTYEKGTSNYYSFEMEIDLPETKIIIDASASDGGHPSRIGIRSEKREDTTHPIVFKKEDFVNAIGCATRYFVRN